MRAPVFFAAAFAFCALGATAGVATAQDTFTFRADRMSGTRALGAEVTVLAGNAEVSTGSIRLNANRIEISGDNNRFIDAIGDVRGDDEGRGITFRADRVRYDRELGIARLEGSAALEDRENEVVVMGQFIEFDEESDIVVIQIAARIFQEDTITRSEHAVFRREERILDLSGFPVVFRGDDEFRADRIRVDLDTNDVTMEGSVAGTIRN
ncbi:MAG: hypothetical protein FWE09_07820 [Treponema sp.]|nr:hypothetical protein [Treponema sp.]